MRELRLYTFINFYLSSIQQGIQTAHIVQELNNKYAFSSESCTHHIELWGVNFKTIIVCNGGGSADLKEGIAIARTSPFAWAEFYESGDCLSGALTGFGIILPDSIFDCTRAVGDAGEECFVDPDGTYIRANARHFDLIKYVKSKGLAR